ncbi:hypothetical protein ES703_92212 [subsurface metagenome]
MKEETTGELLERLLAQKGMSQRKLSILSDVDRGYINSLIKGKGGSITLRIAKQLAKALDVSPEIFLKPAEPILHKETPADILERLRVVQPVSIPVYTEFPFHAGGFTEPVEYVYRERTKDAGKNIEGYEVHGSCLEPIIHDGDIIIIDMQGEIDNGDIVACLVDEKLCLGRMRKIADDLILETKDGMMRLEEAQLAAPVIEVIRRLK